MKLISYLQNDHENVGLYHENAVYKLQHLHKDLPNNILILLAHWEEYYPILAGLNNELVLENKYCDFAQNIDSVTLLAPVPSPVSCRDAYAFRQHVATSRMNRGLPMIEAFDAFPVFYFTNHNAIQGPGDVWCMPDHFQRLDFELECAIVIGKTGRNILAKDADKHIAGLMIMNDVSARLLQMEEMQLNLGPAKGKDFATSFGPWMVTLDELAAFETTTANGHTGKTWNLEMACYVNDILVSKGNLADMNWTFAEIIERASYGVTLYPGDIIGSGTVGTGCFLELNGTGKRSDENYTEQWLQPDDVVKMMITGLGNLVNTMKLENTTHSILALKK